MAIQSIDLTVPGGDTPRSANTKINANFSNKTHAANRLVGTAAGNVMEVGAFGIGGTRETHPATTLAPTKDGFVRLQGEHDGIIPLNGYPYNGFSIKDGTGGTVLLTPSTTGSAAVAKSMGYRFITYSYSNAIQASVEIYTTGNTKLDTNGAIAPSSPTIDLYSDHIEPNDDGESMNPEFIRNGVGDYTIKNTTGLRDEGWYIKIPNDMNGNPKVAVAIDTDKDGNLSIKTYKRTFSLETFVFGPDLNEPLDIPEGRWIDLRFNDLPQETPTNLDKTNL